MSSLRPGRTRPGSTGGGVRRLAVVLPHAVLPRFRAAAGLVIDCYVDEAEGELAKGADGKMAMTRVTLRPRIDWLDEGPIRRRSPTCTTGARGLLHRQFGDDGSDGAAMKLGRLNHVGVATPSIERSVALYRDLHGRDR